MNSLVPESCLAGTCPGMGMCKTGLNLLAWMVLEPQYPGPIPARGIFPPADFAAICLRVLAGRTQQPRAPIQTSVRHQYSPISTFPGSSSSLTLPLPGLQLLQYPLTSPRIYFTSWSPETHFHLLSCLAQWPPAAGMVWLAGGWALGL